MSSLCLKLSCGKELPICAKESTVEEKRLREIHQGPEGVQISFFKNFPPLFTSAGRK